MTRDVNPLAVPSDFVRELLTTCPELDGDWVDADVVDPDQPYYGIYMAFCHAILPALRQLLDPTDQRQTAPQGVVASTQEDLLPRMYAVLERAALSADKGLREAVATELGDGYCRLSQADLLTHAQEATRHLVGFPRS